MLLNAGMVCGVGDFRQEKGKGSFGTFAPTAEDIPPHLLDLNAQLEAMKTPTAATQETLELMREFDLEVESRK